MLVVVAAKHFVIRCHHLKQVQNARVKQVPLLLIVQEDKEDLIDELLRNYVIDKFIVFGGDDSLEEFDDLHVELA